MKDDTEIRLNGAYEKLPKEVYYQCVWTVRDLERLQKISGNDEHAAERLQAIYDSLEVVPWEYRESLLRHLANYGEGYDDLAHENTWKRWKKVYISNLATHLHLI